jgi:hypothetical protein
LSEAEVSSISWVSGPALPTKPSVTTKSLFSIAKYSPLRVVRTAGEPGIKRQILSTERSERHGKGEKGRRVRRDGVGAAGARPRRFQTLERSSSFQPSVSVRFRPFRGQSRPIFWVPQPPLTKHDGSFAILTFPALPQNLWVPYQRMGSDPARQEGSPARLHHHLARSGEPTRCLSSLSCGVDVLSPSARPAAGGRSQSLLTGWGRGKVPFHPYRIQRGWVCHLASPRF